MQTGRHMFCNLLAMFCCCCRLEDTCFAAAADWSCKCINMRTFLAMFCNLLSTQPVSLPFRKELDDGWGNPSNSGRDGNSAYKFEGEWHGRIATISKTGETSDGITLRISRAMGPRSIKQLKKSEKISDEKLILAKYFKCTGQAAAMKTT